MTTLSLSNNVILSVEPRVFDESANLTSLKYTSLSHNEMTELEPWPLIRTQLEWTTVDLSSNRITNFTNARRLSFDCNATLHIVFPHRIILADNDVKHITDVIHGWNIAGKLVGSVIIIDQRRQRVDDVIGRDIRRCRLSDC